jgi:site-specific DNA recombinase
MSKRAFAYVRVSKEDPNDEKWGADSQRQRIIEYCAYKKWELVDIAEDRNVSGVTPFEERAGWSKIAAQFQRGDIVIVSELTRLGRRLSMTLLMLEDLQDRGLEIASLENDLDTTTPVGRLVLHILLSFAAFERDLLIARLKAAHAEIHRQGKALGCSPTLGYDYNVESKAWNINEDEAELVNHIFDLKIMGYGFSTIAERLATEGVPTKRGGAWRAGTVKQIIESRRYIGERDYNNKILPLHAPVIIDHEMWEMAQASIRHQQHQPRSTYILSGLLYCDRCGAVMHRGKRWKNGQPTGQADWRCSSCGTIAICESIAEPTVLESFFAHVDPAVYQAAIQAVEKMVKKGQGRSTTLRKRLAAIERKQSRLLDEFGKDDTTLTRAAFAKKNTELQGEVDELSNAIQQIEDQALLSQRPRQLGNIREDWPTMDLVDQQTTLKDFVSRVTVASRNGVRGADRLQIQWH